MDKQTDATDLWYRSITDITDHYMTFLQYPIKYANDCINVKNKIMFRLINDESKNKFPTMLETYDWNTVVSDNIDTFTDTFISVIYD